MKVNRWRSPARCGIVARAEFRKVWASRVPLIVLLAIPLGTYLFVFELYHVEKVADHLPVANALDVMPVLFFAAWKTMLLQAALLTFAASWATLDSQYGMIRVVCCQPISRVEYFLGKCFGITLHVVVFTVTFVASLLAWTGIYSGFQGVHLRDLLSVLRFAVELMAFAVAFASIAVAVASARRTQGSGIVIAFIAVLVLAFMTMVPFRVLPPRFVFMRYWFFPGGELKNPFPSSGGPPMQQLYSVAQFYQTVLVTPLVFLLPAVLYFRSRDIVE